MLQAHPGESESKLSYAGLTDLIDVVGAVAPVRWVPIHRAGFGERDDEAVVDLVSMHVRRLVSHFPARRPKPPTRR